MDDFLAPEEKEAISSTTTPERLRELAQQEDYLALLVAVFANLPDTNTS